MDKNTWDFIQSVKEGDTNAYERMYLMYKDKIYALALSTLKNRQDAEDATQQTFITVYEKLHTLQDNGAFNTWIQRIAINESNMILRKRRGDVSIDDDTNGSLAERVEDELMLPQEYLEREDLSRRLREIIDELPAVQRQALVLQMYSNMTMAEIAQVMDCSENTVKSRIRYAKAYIRTEIEERERKSGEKFYGIVFLPFGTMFVHLVQQQSMSAAVAAKIWGAVSAKIAAAAAAGTGAGAAAGAKAGMSVGTKIAIGTLAGAVVIGGGAFGVTQILAANDDKPAPEMTQETIVDTMTEIPSAAATEALTEIPSVAATEALTESPDAEGIEIIKAAAKEYMVPANSYYRMNLIINTDGTIQYHSVDNTANGMGATSDSHAKLTFDKKLTEYSYAYSVSDYALDEGSDDYLRGITSITIYTPETPVSALPENIVSWLNLTEQETLDKYLVIDSNNSYYI